MKDILYPEEMKQEYGKRLLRLKRREKMYYLIRLDGDGDLCVKQYHKRELERQINKGLVTGKPYKFVQGFVGDQDTYYPSGESLLINGDIVIPREKRVVIEYEVE